MWGGGAGGGRRRRALVAMLAAALALVAAGAASAREAAAWQYHQLDGDRCWDLATMDANANGSVEDARYDVDNDCRWDTRLWNSVGGDWFLESLTFDMNEDGRWEYWLADNDQQEGFDVAYFDDDADGWYDRWAYLRRAPTTSLAEILGNSTYVGGAPQRTGALGLVEYLARFTGRAAWAAPDADADGWPDHMDSRPRDARYR